MPDCYLVFHNVVSEQEAQDVGERVKGCAGTTEPKGEPKNWDYDGEGRKAWARVRYDDWGVAEKKCEDLKTCSHAHSCTVVRDGDGPVPNSDGPQ
jgi:hypothetical protein